MDDDAVGSQPWIDSIAYAPPLIGNSFDPVDFTIRLAAGATPLLIYGFAGSVEESILAWNYGQVPLAFGFTLDTPWSVDPMFYDQGIPGIPADMQWDPQLRGQRVVGPLRTHTTGIIDFGVRNDLPFARAAEELVHPGRASLLDWERVSTASVLSGTDRGLVQASVSPVMPVPSGGSNGTFETITTEGQSRQSQGEFRRRRRRKSPFHLRG
jgi:hypothetical protein